MAPVKSSFLDKVLGRIGRLDAQGLQTVVERLARERTFLETLFNTIEDGVLVVDAQSRVLYLNQGITRLLGWQPERVEGQSLARLWPEVDLGKLLEFNAKGGARVARHEFEIFHPIPRYLRLYAAPLDVQDSGSSGAVLILHDATEARQKTFEAIEGEKIQALTLLAASVAHEIGNPLNALHIHLQLMEREVRKLQLVADGGSGRPARAKQSRGPAVALQNAGQVTDVAEKLHHYLGVARGEVSRLDYIITQFLQAIRPTPPQVRHSSLNTVAEETLELLRPELTNRGIEVETRLQENLPLAPFDANQLKQVLVNLAKNAMQSMTKGGRLSLETGDHPENVWVSVADTGGGIPEEKINRIFEPFYTTKKKGTGLGLMIVQRIVREHGGRIEINSLVGKGTTFRIWLPKRERPARLLGGGPGNG